jgi:hypothetical protein
VTITTSSSNSAKVDDPLSLVVRWQQGCRNLGDFADRVQRIVSALRAASPFFHHLYLIGNGKKDSPALADDLSNLRPWIFSRAWNDLAPKSYSHRLPDGTLSAESMGELGFAFDLGNLQPPVSKITLRVSDGGPLGGGLSISLPPWRTELHTVASVKTMLTSILPAWDVRCAYTSTLAWNERVNPDATDGIKLPIGGITYSSEASLIDVLSEETPHERLGSGVLVVITERPDLLTPADVQRALRLRDRLAASGRLSLQAT